MVKNQPAAVERYSPWLLGWFRWYIRRYLPKHFHAMAVARDTPPAIDADERLVVYLNHAAWWDPLVAQISAERFFADRRVYAPFDAEAIAKYPLFERMGFFGVDQNSRRGAAEFLKTASAVLDAPGGSLWLTPEGRFCDPRDQAAPFEPGLAHLAAKLAGNDGPSAVFVPLAIEYPFWEERLPEVLIRFGQPVRTSEHPDYSKEQWAEALLSGLRESQVELARLSVERTESAFEVLLGGAAGVGGVYDTFRRLAYRLTGRRYQAAHGEKFQT